MTGGIATELDRRLRGPARLKRRLIQDAVDGFTDTVDAYRGAGFDADEAWARATAGFGTPRQLAPDFQRELDVVQARRTAVIVAVTLPLLCSLWHVAWELDPYQTWELPAVPFVLACAAGSLTVGTSLGCALAALLPGRAARYLPAFSIPPGRVALLARTGLISLISAIVIMTAAAPMTVMWLPIAAAISLTAGALTLLGISARRCRRCQVLGDTTFRRSTVAPPG